MASNTSNTSSETATLPNTAGVKKHTAIQYLRPGYHLFHERAPPWLCSCLIWSGIGFSWCILSDAALLSLGFALYHLLKVTRADFLLWNVLCCSQKSVVECIWISHRDFLLNWTHTGSSQGDCFVCFSFFNFQLWFHLLSAQSVVKLFSNTYYITLAMVTCIDFRCLHFFPQCDKMEILFVCANIQNLYMQFLNYCFNLIVLFYLHYYCLRTVLLWMWNRKNVKGCF